MAKLPAIHLYPGDWLRDPVSGCSLAAQGLWLRLLFIGHDAENYGYIFARDLLGAHSSIARRCGCNLEEFETLLAELLEAGVATIEGGFVVSKRMIRDAKLRDVRAQAGRKGGKQKAKQKASKVLANDKANTVASAEDEDEIEDEDKDREKNKVVSKKTFVAPTAESVKAYCRERGNSVDPQNFVDFYTGKGWMVGKNSMVDWKAAVRTWEKSEQTRAGPANDPRNVASSIAVFLSKGKHNGDS